MTIQEAIDIYNKATGEKTTETFLAFNADARKAVRLLQRSSELTKNLGGVLGSRQTFAVIIAMAEFLDDSELS